MENGDGGTTADAAADANAEDIKEGEAAEGNHVFFLTFPFSNIF